MSWIDKNGSESATNLLTRLTNLNDYVTMSKQSGMTIAYSANNVILRQKEESVVHEIRGITEAAATRLKDLESDNTSTVIHYKAIGNNGEYAVVGLIIGTKKTVDAQRANEAAGWRVTITDTTYSAADSAGWTTTRPSAASSTGTVVDRQKTSTRLELIWKQGLDACSAIYQNEEIVTTEFQFLTEQEATAKINQYASNRDGEPLVLQAQYSSSNYNAISKNYTSYKASAKYVSAERGWTVTVVAITYSPAAYYGKLSGVTFDVRWYYITKDTFNRDVKNYITAEPYKRVKLVSWSFGTVSHAQLVEE